MHLLLSYCLVVVPLATEERAADDHPIGKKIAEFRLRDDRGVLHSLDDYRTSGLVVVAFLGIECPVAKAYVPRLVELDQEFRSRGVAFVGINSNQQDSIAQITEQVESHGIKFPVLKDVGNTVADRFGARRTPEVFLLDSDRVVRYWGRIDDQYALGISRPRATRRELATAIEELLAGKPVSTPTAEMSGCFIGRVPQRRPQGTVTYSKDIAPILQKRCVTCHRPGEIGPFSLVSYGSAAAWAETIREVIRDGRMPPWHANPAYGHFANDSRMTEAEKELICQWVEDAAPEGDPKDLPKPLQFPEGWRIPQPEIVFSMNEPFTVPAKGTVPYQYFTIDPGFTEDKWVQASEARPGNRSVVHHLVVFIQPPGSRPIAETGGLGGDFLAVNTPGTQPLVLPDGMARFVPAGSKLVFQVHYTPNGLEQIDQSRVGLVFADPQTVQKAIRADAAINWQFRIPPGADNHCVEATHRFGQDTLLFTLVPHMHLRGKSFRFEAIYPDGTTEILLDVPRYDFNWQHTYLLTEPKLMSEGTILHCTGYFDNSENNPVNPNPQVAVTFGDQTWQEMMVGYFDLSLAHQDLTLGVPQAKALGDGRFEVTFRYRPSGEAKTVHLAGTFNEWSTTAQAMDGPDDQGRFTTRVTLAPGNYEYKFVIDGKTWRHDPGNHRQAGFYHNSVLAVGAP